jgi:hypothetical protein
LSVITNRCIDEHENVHGFVGAGWLPGVLGVEIEELFDDAPSAARCVAQRQSRQRPHLAGGVGLGDEILRCMNEMTLSHQARLCSPSIAQESPSVAVRLP